MERDALLQNPNLPLIILCPMRIKSRPLKLILSSHVLYDI